MYGACVRSIWHGALSPGCDRRHPRSCRRPAHRGKGTLSAPAATPITPSPGGSRRSARLSPAFPAGRLRACRPGRCPEEASSMGRCRQLRDAFPCVCTVNITPAHFRPQTSFPPSARRPLHHHMQPPQYSGWRVGRAAVSQKSKGSAHVYAPSTRWQSRSR